MGFPRTPDIELVLARRLFLSALVADRKKAGYDDGTCQWLDGAVDLLIARRVLGAFLQRADTRAGSWYDAVVLHACRLQTNAGRFAKHGYRPVESPFFAFRPCRCWRDGALASDPERVVGTYTGTAYQRRGHSGGYGVADADLDPGLYQKA